ncbi:TPA: DUF2971 domain-containing protein [Klebsiella pneumoniae]|uniref:DUF2971 domain-containing protein n=1 Tax=Klebsiella pneumoniae TaxID=573 RepID=UPI000E2C911F|nr:DUF2971 domain-containing protein [Klebsiella pneumoniae]MDQ5763973.1 DUF2971 domain-containing protein [Klebsiella pneumoniae]MEC4471620.1 DUF2971 domain-containing protein [Klebsiella pneumoniae]SVX91029.1 Uncharacterised protein [Klebsiella pneumoniae]SYP99406.1 Uncharacterised protein [Klebsiella pneumoniae]HDO6765933.1 DUF2971 domain-containing protein [Klebsiella pneumoniae]
MIYHYTDLTAAKSIAENEKIWLTECRYLNDKEEFTTGLYFFKNALQSNSNYINDYPFEFVIELENSMSYLSKSELTSPEAAENLFVASFSHTPDSLSQWRSYGMFMLEFEENFISTSLIEDDFFAIECFYAKSFKEGLAHAQSILEQKIIPRLYSICKNNNIQTMDYWLRLLIEIYALSFKNQAFESEHEKRLVIACKNDDAIINFRVKGDLLIPYILLDINPCSLMSITVGPIENQYLSISSLEKFGTKITNSVREIHCKHDYNLHINGSSIPYRKL